MDKAERAARARALLWNFILTLVVPLAVLSAKDVLRLSGGWAQALTGAGLLSVSLAAAVQMRAVRRFGLLKSLFFALPCAGMSLVSLLRLCFSNGALADLLPISLFTLSFAWAAAYPLLLLCLYALWARRLKSAEGYAFFCIFSAFLVDFLAAVAGTALLNGATGGGTVFVSDARVYLLTAALRALSFALLAARPKEKAAGAKPVVE